MPSDEEVTVHRKRKRVSVPDESDEEIEYVRKVQFKYENKIQFLPVKTKLSFHMKKLSNAVDDSTDSVPANGVEPVNNNGSKSKGKSSNRTKSTKKDRRSKTATETITPGPQIRAPEAVFKFTVQAKESDYKEPPDCQGFFNRYIDSVKDDEELPVEYDMDEEDVMWMDTMNLRRKQDRQLEVDPETIELLMDRFEREALFQQSGNQAPPIDEDAVCCICNDGECQNSNAIIFCDMCNLAVHQECYGVPYVPEGQWMCRRCMQSPSVAVDCALCPNKGGAFKQTDDNGWAHVTCALWIPEVCFGNTVFLEPIENIQGISPQRWKLNCSICRKKRIGACIQCEFASCCTAFHVTCAAQANLYMRIEAVKKNTNQGPVSTVKKVVYCPIHCPNKKKGKASNGGIYSSGDEDGKADNAKMLEAQKIMEEKRDFVPIVSVPAIPEAKLSDLSNLLLFPRRNDFLLRLYAYWKLKRQTTNGAPLIRLTSNPNQHYKREKTNASPPRDTNEIREEMNDSTAMRVNFEMLRNMLELLKKREKLKQKLLKEDRNIFLIKYYSLPQTLLSILDRIVEKDTNRFFLEPVSIEDAPDYFEHIKEPMDLGTMRKKAETFQYSNFQEFKNDLGRIVHNCLYYNDKDTIFHKAALKLQPQIDNIMKDYAKYLK